MQLLPNEERLINSNDNKIILTSHRIQMTDTKDGNSYSIVIFLEDISSIETKYKSKPLFFTVGCLAIIIGFFASVKTDYNNALGIGCVVGAVFLALWWFSRKHIISISSSGGKALNFQAERMADSKIQHFLDVLQLAKYKRMNKS